MRQVRLVSSHPVLGRLLSRCLKSRDLTVNFVILSGSLGILASPHLLKGVRLASTWMAFQLRSGYLIHLPGVLIFIAIAAILLFVQEIEKRRRPKP